jgi:predicted transcriptional regulator
MKEISNLEFLYRSHFDIIYDILKTSSRGATAYNLIQKSKLSFEQYRRYLIKLQRLGLIKIEQHHSKQYITTDRGKKFIEKYQDIMKLLDDVYEL